MTTIYSISNLKEKSFRKSNTVLHCIIQGYRSLACTCMHKSYRFALKISVIDFVMDICIPKDTYTHHISPYYMVEVLIAIFNFKKLCDCKLHKRMAPLLISHDWCICYVNFSLMKGES